MASLDTAYNLLLQQVQNDNSIKTNKTKQKIIPKICPNCKPNNTSVYITNDFIRECGCSNCGHIFWKHGVTPECNCVECLNPDMFSKFKKIN
jgi:hypothetical protein